MVADSLAHKLWQLEQAVGSCTWSLSVFEQTLKCKDTIVRLAHDKESIVGYMIAQKVLDNIEIQQISVHPDYRRKGIAMSLLDQLIQIAQAESVERILLEVRASNHGAIRLYLKAGFQQDGIRKQYYTCGYGMKEDAYLMSFKLTH
jgi:ribosomal-protein-alanine N-acetyltransferase